MAAGSEVVITYDPSGVNLNITPYVMFRGTKFTTSSGAIPGTAEIQIRDQGQERTFTTGKEIRVSIDGTYLWGGYLMQVERRYAFPADDTNQSPFPNRMFTLHCVDYNILFDRRVIRNTSDYYHHLPDFYVDVNKDGTLLKQLLASYVDIPAGFDATSEIDDIYYLTEDQVTPAHNKGMFQQQGTILRKQFENFALFSGAVWYIGPDKKFYWKAIEDSLNSWGFSDQPDYGPITVGNVSIPAPPNEHTNIEGWWPFREVSATEDGTGIVNDALVWGGSVFSGSDGGTVFYRAQNTGSQTEHGRWQMAETYFGNTFYSDLPGVTARARAIVGIGPTSDDETVYSGTDLYGNKKGLKYAQWNLRFSWFAHEVPYLSTTRWHVRPGYVYAIDLNAHSVLKLLPCRRLTMEFVELDANGDGIVKFSGDFALTHNDPYQMWDFLLKRESGVVDVPTASVDDSSPSAVYGALGTFTPTPTPNGAETVFYLPNNFGYIPNTLQVFLNGLLQKPNTDVVETDNQNGEFTMTSAPYTGDNLHVVCRTLAT